MGYGGIDVSAGGMRVLDGGLEAHFSSPVLSDDAGGSVPAVLLSASHDTFSGDVLRVVAGGKEAADAGAVLIRASAEGRDVFEMKVREYRCISGFTHARRIWCHLLNSASRTEKRRKFLTTSHIAHLIT